MSTEATPPPSNPNPPQPAPQPAQATGTDPKTIGIIAYLTLIGWVIALVLNDKKDPHASFHVRQSLGIMIVGIASGVSLIIPFLGMFTAPLGYLLTFVLWVIGLIGAAQGTTKPVPILGDKFQEWFKGI